MSLVKFNVTRNSPKWTLNSSGNLQSGSGNLPGFEFNPDNSYKGVLVETASTNIIEDSTEIGDLTYWAQLDGVTVVLNDAESPNGNTNATEVTLTGTSGDVNAFISVANGETYTVSCFFKKGTSNVAYIECISAPFNNGQATFNIDTKSISLGNWTSGEYQELGDGWYRFWVTDTATSTGAVRIRFGLNGTSGQTMYMFGAQLEESPIATSYIKTTNQTVTRNEDVITLTSASQYLPSEGKVTLGWEQREDDTIYIGALSASVASGSRELVYEYSSTEQTLSIDGTEVQTITGQFDFSGMDKIQLGHVNGADQPNTHLKYFAVE